MMKLPFMDKLGSVGFVGERKALALLCLGFYTTLFFMIGLSALSEIPEGVPVFTALTLMYGEAFFSVAAGADHVRPGAARRPAAARLRGVRAGHHRLRRHPRQPHLRRPCVARRWRGDGRAVDVGHAHQLQQLLL